MPGIPDVVRGTKSDMMRRAEGMEEEGKTRDNRKRWGRSVPNDRVISRFWRAMSFGWRAGDDVEAGRLIVPPPSYTAAGEISVGSQAPDSLWEQNTGASSRDKTILDGGDGRIHGGFDFLKLVEWFESTICTGPCS